MNPPRLLPPTTHQMKDLYRSLRMLRDHERGIKPDAAWVKATRERLLMQVSNSMPTREAAKKNKRVLAEAYPGLAAALRGPVLAMTAIVGVVFGGSFASVRAAERSLPGDMLYPVKLVTEQTRLAFEKSKTEKVKLKVEFTRRRAEELKTVFEKDLSDKPKRIAIAADLLKQDFNTLKEQLVDAKQTVGKGNDSKEIRNVVETVKEVDRNVVETVQVIKEMKGTDLPLDVKQKVVDAEAQAADAGVHALEVLVSAAANQEADQGIVTEQDIDASVLAHSTVVQNAISEALEIASSTASSVEATARATTSSVSIPVASGVMAQSASATLGQVQVLVQENKIAEAVDKLREASTKSYQAQTEARKESSTVTNVDTGSLTVLDPSTSTSTTPASGTTSTSTNQATSTAP